MISYSRVRPFGLRKFVLSAELALIFFFSLRPANDPDYGWHIANGSHVLDGVVLSGRDPYSWTANAVWVAHEWVTEAVMKLIDHLAGPSGNSILAALVFVTVYGMVVLTVRRRGVSLSIAIATIPLCFVGALRSVAVRPHVVELLFVALLVWLIESYLLRRLNTRRFITTLACLALLWVNMHGSFPLETVIIAITAVELFLVSDNRWKVMTVASAVSILSFIVNPWGWRIYAFAVQSVASHPTQTFIQEWQSPKLTEWLALPVLVQFLLAAIGFVWSISQLRRDRRTKSGDNLLPLSVGLLRVLAFGFLALQSGRHIMLFGVVNAWLIALGVRITLRRFRGGNSERNPSLGFTTGVGKELINVAGLTLIVATILVAGWRMISPEAQQRSLASRYPVGLLEDISRSYKSGDRLFNEYRWGGFLIQHTSVPVFIDGRSELYGDRQLERYASIVHMEPDWQHDLDRMKITLVLMPRTAPLSSELSRRGWRTVAADSVGWLLARN